MSKRRGTLEDRLWRKVVKFEKGCWVWTGALSNLGYARLGVWQPDGRLTVGYAHRVMYEVAVGPIPDGYEIDHLCQNRWCVRPDHLEPVTVKENRRRRDMNPRLPRRRPGEAKIDKTNPLANRNRRIR